MSKHQAREAAAHFVGRPAYVAQSYAMSGVDAHPEVTSVNLFADLRAFEAAVPAEEIAATADRNRLMASSYGYNDIDDGKPFAFANGVAIIPIHGVLINRYSYSWGFATGYNFLRAQVAAALADPDVKTIVYDVNSCGGMVSGCIETADAIFNANKANGGKPSIAVVDANCFSAAYLLVSGADYIVLTPSGMAGSIGTLMMHVDYSKALDKAGVNITYIFAGKHKVDGNPTEPLSDDVRETFQADIDACYDTFVGAVVRGRGLSDEDVRGTEARCFSADDALSIGLVDAVRNPSEALSAYNDTLDTDDVDETEQPEREEQSMAVKPEDVAAANAATAARVAERTRIAGITGHANAAGREALANHLAMNTDLDIDTSVGILASAEKKAAPVAAAAAPAAEETPAQAAAPAAPAAQAGAGAFREAMGASAHPQVGPSSPGAAAAADKEEELTPAQRILALQRGHGAARAVKAA